MPKVVRNDAGRPLREALKRRHLTLDQLAEKTKQVDPEGRGVSPATIARLTGRGTTARERTELRTAWLISEALDDRMHALFSRMPTHSTATVERSSSDAEEE
ncbi:XRE family transcriptional regulator [Streptomyces griseus]|uniref:helix-turn-helix transcriptional regulator n=1 Tax=Streptomyces TaxID=1883 RepID=UPI00296F4DA2|nr:helix-turn-helix transcriptional regulator [Streptomyces californicus]MDW4900605.1 helix-turn-helix transcriptional regulator [Streptomyces californicus]